MNVPAPAHTFDLSTIELGCTLIVITLALCFPQTGSRFFARLEKPFGRLARNRRWSIFAAGASACLLRVLILPLSPIPHPWIQDDFSFLLAADTFAHGRLTNPTPPLWTHFESFHITLVPSYMSMYFPAQGLFMAAGQVLTGHPWWGVWASCGLMCAALCWMLQAWLPPGWALLGAMLAVLHLATFSYWIDSYSGGAVPAIGGALVLGAVPRILKALGVRDFFWLALGLAILVNSRPYEGFLVSLPSLTFLAWHLWKRQGPSVQFLRNSRKTECGAKRFPADLVVRAAPIVLLIRRTAPAALLLAATVGCMGYYNYRVFGNALTLPYVVNRAEYASAPHFLFQSARPEPYYRHVAMRNFYTGWEMQTYRDQKASLKGFAGELGKKILEAGSFYLGFALIPLLVLLPRALRRRKTRLLTVTAGLLGIGLLIETFFIAHYLAPATALMLALLLQAMRYLRVSGPRGLFLVRATPAACVLLAAVRIFAQPLQINLPAAIKETGTWAGSTPLQERSRAPIEARLGAEPGDQLAIVRYKPDHLFPEWVYNRADIDGSKVIWAREMDPSSDRELLDHYKGRRVWLVEPDADPPRLTPYPDQAPVQSIVATTAHP